MVKCGPSTATGENGISLQHGNESLISTNFSLNYAKSNSAFSIETSTKFFGLFNNFINNQVLDSSCIRQYRNTNNELKNNNFIGNNSPNNGIIYIWSNGGFIISNSIFYLNIIYLFFVSSGFLNIQNCYIVHIINSLQYGSITTSNLLITNNLLTNTFNLIHYKTYLCFADKTLININISKKLNLFHRYIFLFHLL